MATQNTPVKHLFRVVNPERYKEVRHYELKSGTEISFLPHWANISRNREFNKSQDVAFWYKSKDLNGIKWTKVITGLKRTRNSKVYFGDIPKIVNGKYLPRHLLIFVFSTDSMVLTIYAYKDFYPSDEEGFVNHFITSLQ